MKKEFDVMKHVLVPKHILLKKNEVEELLQRYKITLLELPRISINDPAIKGMNPNPNDVVKIIRPSPTAGTSEFYRRVVK